MKIMVPVKRVIDYKAIVRIKPDGSAVETNNVKMSMNPFDEIALEEAIRFKEKGQANEIIALTIGTLASQDILRSALAMGADRAILIETDKALDPLAIAKVLKEMAEKEDIQLALLGKQAIDSDDNQVGQMLAGLLDWPQATFASSIEKHDDVYHVTREVDGGLQTIALSLPAVITVDLRLNEPRYLSLPNIMKAKSKPLTVLSLNSLVDHVESGIQIQSVSLPPKRKKGIKVENVSDLVHRLKQEAKVIE